MFKYAAFAALISMSSASLAADVSGLVTKPSRYAAGETVERLDKIVRSAGLTVFATIDHAGTASKAGLQMPSSTVLIFGNPKSGTPMMVNTPSIAIDLPLRILVWDDAAGKTWVSYYTASALTDRHGLRGMDAQVQGVDGALNKLTSGVTE